MTAAAVLIPTHDHGATLFRSVGSALAQTVEDLEVLVVGDGVPAVTREVMDELARSDQRVRFFDNPKGPRHGELHRHAALQEAQGEIVCYLADDDLWLPGHVEEMRRLLQDADFAHALPFWIDRDGGFHNLRVDLAQPYWRELLLSGENRIPLSCGAHTLDLYRRLPEGWRTTPGDTFTDLHMWQQILAVPGCRAVSGTAPTVLHFPSFAREGWTEERRLDELDAWSGEPELGQRVLEDLARDAAGQEELLRTLEELLRTREDELRTVYADFVEADRDRARLSGDIDRLGRRIEELDAELAERGRELAHLSSSVTWRLRERLVNLPLLGAPFRWVAKALAGPEAPEGTGSERPAPTPAPSAPATGPPDPDPPSDKTARRSDPSTR
jgi:GalNAc5-diNAcBac-PP-undecaprenol beta-1,3-glucosyltransferase